MSTQTTKNSNSITDFLSSLNLSSLIKSNKAVNNTSINNIPDLNTYLNQQKNIQDSSKSTQGLVGFSGDSSDPLDAIRQGQNVNLDDIAQIMRDEQFGNVQVDTQTAGGTQTKTAQVGADFLTTISQEQLAQLSVKQRAQFDALWKKLTATGTPFQAVQTLTNDAVNRAGNGASPQVTIQKSAGLRGIIDNFNTIIQGKIAGLSTLKPQSKPTGNGATDLTNTTNSSSSDLSAVASGDPQSFDSVAVSQV